jgi:hypothetical protein
LSLLLQLGFGLNPLQSGWLTFTSVLAAVFLKPAGPPLLRWMGFRGLLIVSAILMAAMIAGFARFHATTPHIVIALYLFVFGFIRVLQNTVITTLAYADLTHEIMSQGTTIASIAQQLAQGFGIAVAAALLALTSHGAATISTTDFPPVFIFVGLLSLGTMWGFLRLTPEDGALVTGASVVEATD